ncbi:MAG TPA: hypothetical protein VES19_03595 [Candidatus Limnocylindrales bacterium]|nr:hypothetical protein [Candidatus Limnocylindrales bacterium]
MRTSPRPAEGPAEIDPKLDVENGEFDFGGLPRGVRHPEKPVDPNCWFEVTDEEHARRRSAEPAGG